MSDRIEAVENLLDEALGLANDLGIWLDTSPLIRMDEGKQAEVETKLVGGKIKKPDEGRRRFDLEPTAGGNTLWGQHQDYPLGVLAERNDLVPVAPAAPEPDPDPEETPEDEARFVALLLEKELSDAEYS